MLSSEIDDIRSSVGDRAFPEQSDICVALQSNGHPKIVIPGNRGAVLGGGAVYGCPDRRYDYVFVHTVEHLPHQGVRNLGGHHTQNMAGVKVAHAVGLPTQTNCVQLPEHVGANEVRP
jgi:hypothetical protein